MSCVVGLDWTPLLDRFWQRVQIGSDDECWQWLGSTNTRGYGRLSPGHRSSVAAHRLAVFAHTGVKPPAGAMVCHTCDNPPCVNPRHLYVGTAEDNARDRTERRRSVLSYGASHMRAKLTALQAERVREAYAAGGATMRALATVNNVSVAVVHGVVNGSRYCANGQMRQADYDNSAYLHEGADGLRQRAGL